uniref:NADH dehydrogenase subunit 2 n=1 Tax=Marcia japonica TaxID=368935 RepID=UPI00223895BE|nr:NADH dehydrogenase subunit 2 [Marcia japonica]UYR95097.1 NADH dehydrogenase subunit 2 [Marcia japonica]
MLGMLVNLSMVSSLIFSVLGIFLSFFSVNLLGIWVGMELSFLSVICFSSGSSVEESESMMKYFIIQVLGSCVCGMGFLLCVNNLEAAINQMLILIGMFMKLGVFPFHFWVSPVVNRLSWSGCGVILILQKLVPLWVLSNYLFLFKDLSRVEFLCCFTSLVGCLGGLNVLNYRTLLGFSSIQNLGPMILLCCCQEYYLWVYVLAYMCISGFLIMSLWNLNVYSFIDLMKEKVSSQSDNLWWVCMYFFSLAGLPPFSGIIMKVSLLLGCWNSMPLGSGICVISSCVSLFFYLSVILAMVISWGKSLSFFFKKNNTNFSLLMTISFLVNMVSGFCFFLLLSL